MKPRQMEKTTYIRPNPSANHWYLECQPTDAGRLLLALSGHQTLAQHRGRVDPQASPRPGEATASSHGEEVAQVVPMHKLNFANPFGKTDYGSLDSLGLPQ